MKKKIFLLILPLLLLVPSNVFASQKLIPNGFGYENWDSRNVQMLPGNITTIDFNARHFYGIGFPQGTGEVASVVWTYSPSNELDSNSYYDVSATIVVYGFNYVGVGNVFTASLRTGSEQYYTCEVGAGSVGPVASTGRATLNRFHTVKCSNVKFDTNYSRWDLSVYGHTYNEPNTAFYITALSVTKNSANETTDAINKNTAELKNQTDTIKSTDTSESQTQANNFFSNFNSDDHGLSGIITAPLSAINKLSQSCVSLTLPLPNNVGNIELPCMDTLYSQYVPTILSLWHVVIYGILGYWIYKDIYRIVSNIKNPDDDKVEVLDL